jgi:uncharacterized protein
MGGDWKDMFYGVETNNFDLVKYYISKNIDLNYQHPEFLTSPLIESIQRNHIDMMLLLLENGAKPDLKEAFSYKSPIEIAKNLKNLKALSLLNQYLGTNESFDEEPKTNLLEKLLSNFAASLKKKK